MDSRNEKLEGKNGKLKEESKNTAGHWGTKRLAKRE